MIKNQGEASSSSDHGRNEGQESSANFKNPGIVDGWDEEREELRRMNENEELIENLKNLEINPNGDNEEETVGTNEEHKSTENVENLKETTMADDWNPQRLIQFGINHESILTIMDLFEEQLLGAGSEVERSRVQEMFDGYRTAYISYSEKLKKVIEEGSSSCTHGRNEEQESTSTENAEKCSGNPNEEQELTENVENQEEQKTTENVENLEEKYPVIMKESGRENWLSVLVDEALMKGNKIKIPKRRRK